MLRGARKRPGSFFRLKRRGPPIGAPTPGALRAVVFCIDAATRSGIATYVAGKLHHYDEVNANDPIARRHAVRDAITTAEVRDLPLGCVIETPFGGRFHTVMSLNATVKLWRDSWIAAYQPLSHLMEQTAGDWRRALFGARPLARPMARQLEARVALERAEHDLPDMRHYKIGPDAAAAICIGQVMIRSSNLRTALECECVSTRGRRR